MKTRIHWHQHKKKWTTQTYKGCTQNSVILVEGDWTTEVNPNAKSNPRGHVVCDSAQVKTITYGDEVFNDYAITGKLLYDKDTMKFNIDSGTNLLCFGNKCYTLKTKGE